MWLPKSCEYFHILIYPNLWIFVTSREVPKTIIKQIKLNFPASSAEKVYSGGLDHPNQRILCRTLGITSASSVAEWAPSQWHWGMGDAKWLWSWWQFLHQVRSFSGKLSLKPVSLHSQRLCELIRMIFQDTQEVAQPGTDSPNQKGGGCEQPVRPCRYRPAECLRIPKCSSPPLAILWDSPAFFRNPPLWLKLIKLLLTLAKLDILK